MSGLTLAPPGRMCGARIRDVFFHNKRALFPFLATSLKPRGLDFCIKGDSGFGSTGSVLSFGARFTAAVFPAFLFG